MDRNLQNWTKLDRNRQKRREICKNGHKWTETGRIGQKWTDPDRNRTENIGEEGEKDLEKFRMQEIPTLFTNEDSVTNIMKSHLFDTFWHFYSLFRAILIYILFYVTCHTSRVTCCLILKYKQTKSILIILVNFGQTSFRDSQVVLPQVICFLSVTIHS